MKINIGVFFGSKSLEHEISIISANQVINALDPNKYNIYPIYISKELNFYIGQQLTQLKNFNNLQQLITKLKQINIIKYNNNCYIQQLNKSILNKDIKLDLALPIMHGTYGEDGCLSGYFDMLNLPYVGCDHISASLGQDKVIQKDILKANNIPVVDSFWLYYYNYLDNSNYYDSIAEKLGYPLIIKPAKAGSSIGIEIVNNINEFKDKLQECSKYDHKLLIEKVIEDFVEINISIIGNNNNLLISSCEEVLKNDNILSFNDKYLNKSKSTKNTSNKNIGITNTTRIIPANINKEILTKIQDNAKKAFITLGLSGLCRIDFMYIKKTNTIYLTEVNTIPGSLAFYLWKDKGYNFTQLLDHLINITIDKTRDNNKLQRSFDTNILSNY